MIINKSGITIRMEVSELRVMGRATQGVRLIKLNESDEISSVAKIENMDEAEVEKIAEQEVAEILKVENGVVESQLDAEATDTLDEPELDSEEE